MVALERRVLLEKDPSIILRMFAKFSIYDLHFRCCRLLFELLDMTNASIIARFTNLDVHINVDHSTSIDEVIYTLMKGNDGRRIEMESSFYYGLNPMDDRK